MDFTPLPYVASSYPFADTVFAALWCATMVFGVVWFFWLREAP
jgi:hypothetical protein